MAQGSDMKNILYIVDDYWACGWYRCHVPGMELKRLGHDVFLGHQITPSSVEAADIIVLQRQWREECLHALEHAHALGKTVVYELDDDIWNLDPTNPSYEAWNNPELRGPAEALIRGADIVTTTTRPLAQKLRLLNKNTHILPNMLPPEHWQVTRERPEGYDTVAIGWAGSVARDRDLAIVGSVIPQLLDTYPNVVLLVASGSPSTVFPPHERIRTLQPLRIEQYPTLLAQFDIGIAPVVDSRFNQAKSDLKFIEYGMVGLPVVASDVESYTHSIKHGENGFLATNDKDWLKFLRRLIENPDLRESLGQAAKAVAQSRTIDKNIRLWEKAYGLTESGASGRAST